LYLLVGVLSALALITLYLSLNVLNEQHLAVSRAIFSNPFVLTGLAVYLGFFAVLNSFLLQINRKFGPGNLWKFITGQYHHPRDEYRLFMFLDLQSSTTIAEQLGHNRYSQLIQHCFHDLTDLVIRYQAEIYQYVGDEVVLTWTSKKALRQQNFIRLFFAYHQKLHRRRQHYLDQFGVVPKFKAGVEMGTVTVAEVGEIKREIAYHGDVLNTAARIQERCNEWKQTLLVSETVAAQLSDQREFALPLMGELQLRGKVRQIGIYAVSPVQRPVTHGSEREQQPIP
jgi:adenylate cyclase